MKCCCGKYDYTGEVLVVNDIVHEHLGPKGNMCGPLHAIEIRDLRAQLAESKEQMRRRDVFCQEKAELAEFERDRRKSVETQLAEAKKLADEYYNAVSKIADELVVVRLKLTEERRKREEAETLNEQLSEKHEKIIDDYISKWKADESDRDRYREEAVRLREGLEHISKAGISGSHYQSHSSLVQLAAKALASIPCTGKIAKLIEVAKAYKESCVGDCNNCDDAICEAVRNLKET